MSNPPADSSRDKDGLCDRCERLDFETLITGSERSLIQFLDFWRAAYGSARLPEHTQFWQTREDADVLLQRLSYSSVWVGTWADLLERASQGCDTCAFLLKCCEMKELPEPGNELRSDASNDVFLVQHPPDKGSAYEGIRHGRKEGADRRWQVYVSAESNQAFWAPGDYAGSLATDLSPSWYQADNILRFFDYSRSDWKALTADCDMDQIRHWLSNCESHDRCNQTYRDNLGDFGVQEIFPQRLIDLNTDRIVRCSRGSPPPYVTLSYVWGQNANDFVLTTDSPRWARELSGRAYFPMPHDLPATLKDACAVVRTLGFRFLWVDRFCILQDDPQDVLREIQNMSGIFANASLCIVAAAGTGAHAGLPGVSINRGAFSSTTRLSRSPAAKMSCIGLLPRSMCHAVERPSWATRAWTYQELKLSRRCLIFTQHEVFWQCQTLRNRESYTGREIANRGLIPPSKDTFGLYGDFGRLGGRDLLGLSSEGELHYAYESCANIYSHEN